MSDGNNTFDSALMPAILGKALVTLREQCPLLEEVSSNYEGMASELGETVTVEIPAAQAAYDVTPGSKAPDLIGTTPTKIQVAMDKWRGTRFALNTREARQIRTSEFVPGQLAEGVRVLANEVNVYLLGKYKAIYGYVGTASSNPFATSSDILADAKVLLSKQLCPPGNRIAIIGDTEEAAALKLAEFKNAAVRGDAETIRTGVIGVQSGFRIRPDVIARPTHTAGSFSGGAVKTTVAAGLKTFKLKGSVGTGDLHAGDVIKFANHDQTYVVTADVGDVSVDGTDVVIEPALKAQVVNDEVITLKATHKVNIAGDMKGFAFAVRPLPDNIEGAPLLGPTMSMTDADTGLSLKLMYIPGYHAAQFELSIFYGGAVADPRRLIRIAG